MLAELHISGLGVIDDVDVELAPGLNVLTGETGAGKTMVTVGLSLALGARARTGLVRARASRARVEARFAVADRASVAEWAEDGELVLARAVGRDGRSSARAGGQLCPVGTLAELGRELVEMHGQHQTQRLLSPAAQLSFLDRFAGPDQLERVGRYRDVHARLRRAEAALARLDEEAREREREKDLLRYQVAEIEAAHLRDGEVAELEDEQARLAHAERIRDLLASARAALGDEGGALEALARASAAAREAAALDRTAGEVAARLGSLAADADDVGADLRARADAVELDPGRLEAVQERLAAIASLRRKYGEGERAIHGYLERARTRMEALERSGEERDELAAESSALRSEVAALAEDLSASRSAAAPRLADALRAELHDLGMTGASVEVALERAPAAGPDGAEAAVLRFSAGAGQPPMPLSDVASGGELSRTMLACRTVLADLDEVPTLVFDEVDAGIGGRAGVAVGRRLARLARRRQVLVVTHLPQIACFADRHFRVTKDAGTARVAALERATRVEELTRMLSGVPTQEAAAHAEQLLAEAAREKA
ncbi:MAG TPA: DNA repair protein RecN [Actinomycetota bacterium]|nr:DNA repair protein RecN [Actinomycetota bacterium]